MAYEISMICKNNIIEAKTKHKIDYNVFRKCVFLMFMSKSNMSKSMQTDYNIVKCIQSVSF